MRTVYPGGCSEGPRAQTRQKLWTIDLSRTFPLPLDDQRFVDDAGSCALAKQLPAVAGVASRVALLSVESSSAEAS